LPWSFSFVDDLMLVQNEYSGTAAAPEKPGSIVVFKRDAASGRLTTAGFSVQIDKPMFVDVLPQPSAADATSVG
jgi:hypothetical protein